MYLKAYYKSKISKDLRKRIKGNPFYSPELFDEYRVKFGLDFQNKLEYIHQHEDEPNGNGHPSRPHQKQIQDLENHGNVNKISIINETEAEHLEGS